ncbi:MAG: YqeG family HAD IIIA-type phosphatase [Bacilli bacterium]
MFRPDIFVNKITNITPKFLRSNNIKGLIIDIDNTVMDDKYHLVDDLLTWINDLKKHNIGICFVSNTFSYHKKQKLEQSLQTDVIIKALKPSRRGFKWGLKKLALSPKEVAVIGDQLFTDVLGGKRMGMYTIYVTPIALGNEGFLVNLKRVFEKPLIKKYKTNYNVITTKDDS